MAPTLLDGFEPALAGRAAVTTAEVAALGAELARAAAVVVVVGASIPGLCLAAGLATDPRVSVVLVTGPPPVRRRLVNGCSLRRSTLAILGRAMGCGAERLAARLGAPRSAFGELRVVDASCALRETGLLHRSPRPIGLSTRHGAILDALRAELTGGSVSPRLVAAEVPRGATFDGALPLLLADGPALLPLPADRTVILNATPHAALLRPTRALPAPARWVVAVQAPMVPAGGLRYPGDVAVAPLCASGAMTQLAFYTPFQDPDNDEATWYGVNTAVVDATADRAAAIAAVHAGLVAMGGQLGLVAAGGDEARGEAMVPVVEEGARSTHARLDDGAPVVEVSRAFSSGAPAINVDGMLAGARGAEAFAAAFLAAPERPFDAAVRALDAVDAALAGIRARNRLTRWFFFEAGAGLRDRALRWMPRWGARLFTEDFADLGDQLSGLWVQAKYAPAAADAGKSSASSGVNRNAGSSQ